MKQRFFYLLIFSLCIHQIYAQTNLVVNGDFEDNINCQCGYLGINQGALIGCSNPTLGIGSPDYYNICSSSYGIPNNAAGSQFPLSGNGCIGLWLCDINIIFSEYIQISLNGNLIANHHYFFKCYLNRAENFRYATDNFGAYFSNDSVLDPSANILPFQPQIINSFGDFITDTINWIEFNGSYIAHGGEQYIILGNFNNSSIDTLYQYYGSQNHINGAFYYIDDVSLIDLDSALAIKELRMEGLELKVVPNPANESISLLNIDKSALITITDVTGNVVLHESLHSNQEINISPLSPGLYFILTENKKERRMGKFIKE